MSILREQLLDTLPLAGEIRCEAFPGDMSEECDRMATHAAADVGAIFAVCKRCASEFNQSERFKLRAVEAAPDFIKRMRQHGDPSPGAQTHELLHKLGVR